MAKEFSRCGFIEKGNKKSKVISEPALKDGSLLILSVIVHFDELELARVHQVTL